MNNSITCPNCGSTINYIVDETSALEVIKCDSCGFLTGGTVLRRFDFGPREFYSICIRNPELITIDYVKNLRKFLLETNLNKTGLLASSLIPGGKVDLGEFAAPIEAFILKAKNFEIEIVVSRV